MMLGVLIARAGVAVIVLEKHHDFLRDLRGDTAHASTLRCSTSWGSATGSARCRTAPWTASRFRFRRAESCRSMSGC
jgi:2-polyprenyl-6-methoxyphenol hydroxylase-like FAD-dependent oxidoreductase